MKLKIIILLIGIVSFQKKRIILHSVTLPYLTNKDVNEKLYNKCHEWKIDSINTVLFFQNSTQISSIEKHNLFYTLPCEVEGIIEINDTIFDYTINSASWCELRYKNKFYKYLGCFQCGVPFLIEPE